MTNYCPVQQGCTRFKILFNSLNCLSKRWGFYLILLLPNIVQAQKEYIPEKTDPLTEPWRWKNYPELVGKGLRCMAQSQDGLYWFGVDSGLICYNGYKWITYNKSNGFENFAVNNICTNKNSQIWVGTDKGLFTYSKNKWQKIFPETSDSAAEKASRIKILKTLHNGAVIASVGNGNYTGLIYVNSAGITFFSSLKVINRATNKLKNTRLIAIPEVITPDEKFEIEELYEDNQQNIWVSTRIKDGGQLLFTVKITENSGINFKISHLFTEKEGYKQGKYTIIKQASDNTIWMINGDYKTGISKFDGKKWKYFELSKTVGIDELHTSIIETSDKAIWIGGMGSIFKYQDGKWKWYQKPWYPVSTSRIIFYEDLNGCLWIIGKHNEVSQIDYKGKTWQTYKNLNFQCETQDGSKWFIDVKGRVVCEKDNKWVSFGSENGLPDAPVKLYLTSFGVIWAAGSDKGIASTAWFNGEKWIKQLHPNLSWGIDYRAVYEDKEHNIWFGCSVDLDKSKNQLGGLMMVSGFNTSHPQWHHFSRGANFNIYNAYGIGQSEDGTIWIGGSRLTSYKNGILKQIDTAHSINTYYDYVVNEQRGNLWVGSRYYGIFVFDGKKWVNYNSNNGLLSNTIIHILPISGNNILVATDNDFCRFDGKSWINHVFPEQLIFSREGGELIQGRNKSIWINKSLREWKRRALKNNQITPEIIENFYTIQYTGDTLPPNTKITEFKPEVSRLGNTVISWNGNDKWNNTPNTRLAYSYRLNNEEWSEFKEKNYATFTNLKSGKYTFEVRARDLDLNTDNNPALVHFKVMPPPWKQTWFILIVLVFISILVILQLNIFKRSSEIVKLYKELKKSKDQLEFQKGQILEQVEKDKENYLQKINFFTRISHEFRTPLTVISWLTARIHNSVADLNQTNLNQYVTSLSRNTQHLLKLINQLLDYRKLENSTVELYISKINAVRAIEQIYFRFKCLGDKFKISVQLYKNFPKEDAYLDVDKIEKILDNLLSNSLKYTPEGGTIKISILNSYPGHPEEYLYLVVEDTGIGIPEDEIEIIFEPFFQGRTLPLRKHEGTGIGLSLVKSLVELHKGKIWVKSNPIQKNGHLQYTTTFVIKLPCKESDYSSSDLIEDKIHLSETILPELESNLKIDTSVDESLFPERTDGLPLILLVEDNDDLAVLIRDAFLRIYNVVIMRNGEEGLVNASKLLPDLIISDIMMPVMNGIEMCRKIKNDPGLSHIPIILLTAKVSDEDKIEGFEAGADEYIVKPFNIPILRARIKNLIETRDGLRKKFRNELEIQQIGKVVPLKEKDFMQKVIEIIEKNITNPDFDVESLSKDVGVSSRHLLNKIQSLTDYTAVELIRTIRLKKAKQLFLETKLSIAEVAYDVGFSDPNYFSKCFQKEYGKTPKEFIALKTSQ